MSHRGEKLVRTSRRSELVEDIASTITASVREQQRDVQATDRFDIRSESSEVLRSDAARTPGSAASAAYGALVETGSSTEQAQRSAETFGRDIATRAVSLVTERLRTETTHRTVQRFEEEVRHEFDNSKGASHEVVVYQWLDRVIQAQVFTFGKRVFYDFVVPEPAALLLRSVAARRTPDGPLVKPAPFTLSPSQLNEVNYLYYVAGYGATGVTPPPDPQRVVSDAIATNSQNRFATPPEVHSIHEAYKNKLTIPQGYRAMKASIHSMSADDARDRTCRHHHRKPIPRSRPIPRRRSDRHAGCGGGDPPGHSRQLGGGQLLHGQRRDLVRADRPVKPSTNGGSAPGTRSCRRRASACRSTRSARPTCALRCARTRSTSRSRGSARPSARSCSVRYRGAHRPTFRRVVGDRA